MEVRSVLGAPMTTCRCVWPRPDGIPCGLGRASAVHLPCGTADGPEGYHDSPSCHVFHAPPERPEARPRSWTLGPLSWRAHRIPNSPAISGGVYLRGRIVWTLTWWGIRR
jgi:hypothetical protein